MNKLCTCLVSGLWVLLFVLIAQPIFSTDSNTYNNLSVAEDVMDLTFTIGDVSGNQGDQVCVGVSADNFTSLISAQFSMSYDPSVLQFASVGNFNLQDLSAGAFGTGTAGVITMSWSANTNILTGETLADGTQIFEMCFDIVGSSTTNIEFTNTPTQMEVIDASENEVTPVITNNGTVTVGGGTGGGNLMFVVEDAMGNPGDEVCIGVSVNNFENIISAQFTLDYDPSILEFNSVGNFNLQDLNAGAFGTATDGLITMSWSANTNILTGETLPDGTEIFEMCFTVLGNTNTDIIFVSSPTPLEVIDADENIVNDVVTNGGTVTIDNTNTGDLLFDISDANGMVGEELCVSVTADNFANIVSAQFTITYDQTMMQFNGASNFNLENLSASNFGSGANGVITFSWTATNPAIGATVPNGTEIFELCFAPASGGTTTVGIGDSPVNIEVIDANEVPVDPVLTDSGLITIEGPSFEGFGFIITDNDMVEAGTNVCVDVTVQDFIDVISMQYTLNYDPNILTFTSVIPNLVDLDMSDFALPPTDHPEGIITLSWFADTQFATGVTLQNGTTVFTLCFDVAPGVADGTSTSITFGNSPTTIEVIDVNEAVVEPVSTDPGILIIGLDIPPVIEEVNITPISCFGESDGIISIDAVSGDGPFTYQWNVGFGSTITDLGPGTYTVTVTSTTTGLSTVESYTLTQPTQLDITVLNVNHVECSGDNTGSIQIDVDGGTPQYSILWSDGMGTNQLIRNNLEAGIYTATVTDSRGCTDVETVTIQSVNPPLNIVNVITDNVPNGSINIVVSGGSGPGTYSYNWTGPNSYTSSSEDIFNLSNAGMYCVTVTDQNGCTAAECVMLGEDIVIADFSITNTCPGTSNGAIDITVTGGVQPLTYEWKLNNIPLGITTQDISGQVTGVYTVTITDANGTSISGNFDILEYDSMEVVPTITASENNFDGSIQLDVTGGLPPYTYQWDPNVGTGSDILNLPVGTFCVTITDQNGCTLEDCYQVPSAPLTLGGMTTNNVSCNGYTNGSIQLNVMGGLPPYSVLNDIGQVILSGNMDGNIVITDLAPGSHAFRVLDSQGMQITTSALLMEPDPITFEATVVNDIEGPDCIGSITLDINGGSAPYFIDWNGNNSGPQIQSLCSGDYTPTITDSNGCLYVATEALNVGSLDATVNVQNVSCPGDVNGSIDVTPLGTSGYTFEWTEVGSPNVISVNEDLTDVGPGSYNVEITDESGVTLGLTYDITTESNLAVSASAPSDYLGFDVSCFEAEDATIVANADGGVGAYDYEWSLNGVVVGTSQTLSNIGAGSYDLMVVDELGCMEEANIQVAAPTEILLTSNVVDISCTGEENGSIAVIASGGVSTQNYIYQWADGEIGTSRTGLSEGSYSINVVDANGCMVSESFDIYEPDPITVEVVTEPATDGCNGSVRAVVNGGSGSYIYNWLNITAAPTANIVTDLCPGDYFVEVEDSEGCATPDGAAQGHVLDRRFPCLEERVVITPDGNGANDEFIIFCIDDLPDNHLEIYSRWGQLVFEVDNYDNTWEGTTQNGENLPAGPYYFVLEYDTPDGLVQAKGSLTIVR